MMPQKKPTKRINKNKKTYSEKGYKKEREKTPLQTMISLHRTKAVTGAIRKPKGRRGALIRGPRLLRASGRAVGEVGGSGSIYAIGRTSGGSPNPRSAVRPNVGRRSTSAGRERSLFSDGSQLALNATSVGEASDVGKQRGDDIVKHVTSLGVGEINLPSLVKSRQKRAKKLTAVWTT